jgi:hypothetical protein
MLFALVSTILLATGPPTATWTGDLDGSGAVETITATGKGKAVRLQVMDAGGKRLARAEAPSPGSAPLRIAISAGSLGSAGELIEIVASRQNGDQECRTLWRYRGGALTRVPVLGGPNPIPDCGNAGGWTYRWEKSQPDAPADYTRERTRASAEGLHHQTEVYRYTGFRIELDRARSTADINGVTIPNWSSAVLYPRPVLDPLFSRFDLSPLRKSPRLRFETDREKGVFAAILQRPGGVERLPVTGSVPGKEKNEIELTVDSGQKSGQITVRLAPDQTFPREVLVRGLGEDLAPAFIPVMRFIGSAFEVYESAEQELAVQGLSGTWDANNGERVQISLVSPSPAVLRFGNSDFLLNIAQAPAGTDVALLPPKSSNPTLALTLRGPDAFARVRVSCAPANAAEPCRPEGGSQIFHRLGASVAVQ